MSRFLEQETLKKILAVILRNQGVHSKEIAESLHMDLSLVEFHLRYLEKIEIVTPKQVGGHVCYYIEESTGKTRDERTQETRRKICSIIVQNPGLHLSKIAEMLDMSIPLTDFHLRYLEKNEKILAVKDEKGYFKRYYIVGSGIQSQDKKVMEILRKKIPLKIVFLLLQHTNLTHKEIMEQLRIPSSSKLSYHLSTLVDQGIVDMKPHGRERGYTLNNREEIKRLLKKYELHIEMHLAVESFRDLWEDLNY